MALSIQLIISYPLWTGIDRSFPMVPALLSVKLVFPLLFRWLLLLIFVASSWLNVSWPKYNKLFLLLMSGSMLLLIAEDISRLQPWLLHYIPLLFALQHREQLSGTLNTVLGGTYLWAGFWKLNNAFTVEFAPFLAEPVGLKDLISQYPQLAWGAGLWELAAGVLLLLPWFQQAGRWMAIVLHSFLLLVLGPWAHNWNAVIWPWNLCLILLLLILPLPEKEFRLMHWARKPWGLSLFLVFLVLPLLYFFNAWDHHLSGSLYSANNPEAVLYYNEKDRHLLPEDSKNFQLYIEGTEEEILLLDHWAMDDLHAPFYPQIRYFKYLGDYFCHQYHFTGAAGIKIHQKKLFTSEAELIQFPCGAVQPGE